jgi:DNA primase
VVSRELIDAIRERTNLVDIVGQTVRLTSKGTSYMGLCPFHQERSPSFSVVPAKGIYHCFGCGEGGDVFSFLQKTRGLSFFEAVKELGDAAGLAVDERELSPQERSRLRQRASLQEIVEIAAGWFRGQLRTTDEGRVGLRYLVDRQIADDTIDRWRLGLAPAKWDGLLNALVAEGVSVDQAVEAGLARRRERGVGAYDLFRGRLIIPIEDSRGRVVAFGGRVLKQLIDDEAAPKYVNSPETPIYKKSNLLFGLSHARTGVARTGRLLVVEGYFDVISLHQAGFAEAVATCGTALTPEHAKLIAPMARQVVALFDADEAGQRAAVKSLELFLDVGIEPRRLEIGDAKDPDEFIQRYGAEAFSAALARSVPLIELVLARAARKHGTSAGGLDPIIAELRPHIERMSAASQESVLERMSAVLGPSVGSLREKLNKAARPAGPALPPDRRWRGDRDLNHILWLILHYPEEVLVEIAQVEDPSLISDRDTVKWTLAQLLSGASLPAVIDQLQDDDLKVILRVAASSHPGLYSRERAAPAIAEIIARRRTERVASRMADVVRDLAACNPTADRERFMELMHEKQELQRLLRPSAPARSRTQLT